MTRHRILGSVSMARYNVAYVRLRSGAAMICSKSIFMALMCSVLTSSENLTWDNFAPSKEIEGCIMTCSVIYINMKLKELNSASVGKIFKPRLLLFERPALRLYRSGLPLRKTSNCFTKVVLNGTWQSTGQLFGRTQMYHS